MNINFFLVDLYRKTQIEKDFKFLSESQWWDSSRIKSYQFSKLKELLIYAKNNVKYYRDLFNEINFDPDNFNEIEKLTEIPILTKELIKKNFDDLISVKAKKFGIWRKSTGGSTGSPLVYYLGYKSLSFETANRMRAWAQANYKIGNKVIYFGGPSLFGKVDLKRQIYFSLYNFIPLDSFGINDEKLDRYTKIVKNSKAKIMYSYASSAEMLAHYILKNKINTIKLDGVFTTAEMLFPQSRKVIEEAFNCEVYDFYGANDGGISAFECKMHKGFHIAAERSIVEVVNEDGSSSEAGNTGKVITTDLTNYSMPFIRYEVDDLISLEQERCTCGRGLPLIREIKGRTSDFILDENNNRIHGEYFSHVFGKYDFIKQFQIIQEEQRKIKIILNCSNGDSDMNLKEIESVLKQKFTKSDIEFVLVDKITPLDGSKRKFVFSTLNQ